MSNRTNERRIAQLQRDINQLKGEINRGPLRMRPPQRTMAESNATADLWLFEVQSAGTGAGVYNCWQQKSWGIFEGPSTEVFHTGESWTIANPVPALAKGDILACSQIADDEGNMRWAGFQIAGGVRQAIIKEDANDEQHLAANLLDAQGEEIEVEGVLGYDVDVYFSANKITAMSSWTTALSRPVVETGDAVLVRNRTGKWECVNLLGQSEDKPCE